MTIDSKEDYSYLERNVPHYEKLQYVVKNRFTQKPQTCSYCNFSLASQCDDDIIHYILIKFKLRDKSMALLFRRCMRFKLSICAISCVKLNKCFYFFFKSFKRIYFALQYYKTIKSLNFQNIHKYILNIWLPPLFPIFNY